MKKQNKTKQKKKKKKKKKKTTEFLSENFQLLVVKFSIYLNRRVFVMHLFFQCLGKAVFCDCGLSRVISFIFMVH